MIKQGVVYLVTGYQLSIGTNSNSYDSNGCNKLQVKQAITIFARHKTFRKTNKTVLILI